MAGLLGISLATNQEWPFRYIAMPMVSLLDPEKAHKCSIWLASRGIVPHDFTKDHHSLSTTVFGRNFTNPIGLAAGFDKNGEAYCSLMKMGFSHVEVGSVTPLPQEGNPKPRVFRLKEDKGIINRYGFNSDGHAMVKKRVAKWKARQNEPKKTSMPDKQLGINLGKNKDSQDATDDYVKGVKQLGPYADYLVINVSSPNTPGLRSMQKREVLAKLLDSVLKERDQLRHSTPLLVKIAPDLSEDERKDIATVINERRQRVDGIIVSNTTISRPASLKSAHKSEKGGLSGKPLNDLNTSMISDMYLLTDGRIPIIGVGGVWSGQDAFDKICAGASLVQMYSSLAYEGPPIVNKVKRELTELLRINGFSSVNEAVGFVHVNSKRQISTANKSLITT